MSFKTCIGTLSCRTRQDTSLVSCLQHAATPYLSATRCNTLPGAHITCILSSSCLLQHLSFSTRLVSYLVLQDNVNSNVHTHFLEDLQMSFKRCVCTLSSKRCICNARYSAFRGRWDSKWSSECKTKSESETWNYHSTSLFKFLNEKRPRTIVSWFRLEFR